MRFNEWLMCFFWVVAIGVARNNTETPGHPALPDWFGGWLSLYHHSLLFMLSWTPTWTVRGVGIMNCTGDRVVARVIHPLNLLFFSQIHWPHITKKWRIITNMFKDHTVLWIISYIKVCITTILMVVRCWGYFDDHPVIHHTSNISKYPKWLAK